MPSGSQGAGSKAKEEGEEGEAGADPLQFRPKPEALQLGDAEAGAEAGVDGIYRPPRLNPVAMDDDPDKCGPLPPSALPCKVVPCREKLFLAVLSVLASSALLLKVLTRPSRFCGATKSSVLPFKALRARQRSASRLKGGRAW